MIRLAEEILLLILDDEHGDLSAGYSPHRLDVVVAAAVLMELALEGRIDTDLELLFLVDSTPLGDDLLDPTLADIAAGPSDRDAAFWIQRTAEHGGEIRELVLSRLVDQGILERRAGSVFLSRFVARSRMYPAVDGRQVEEVRLRLMRELFGDEIPDPRDGLLICLSDASGFLDRLLAPAEKVQVKDRLDLIRQLDLLGRSLFGAVAKMRESEETAPTRPASEIPAVKGLPFLGSALSMLGDPNPFLARQHRKLGSIFQVRAAHRRIIVLAGPEASRFLQGRDRAHLRSMNAWRFVGWRLGTSKFLFALDGPVHARLRKLVSPGFSVQQIRKRTTDFVGTTREELAEWPGRGTFSVLPAIQRMATRQALSMFSGTSGGDRFEDPRFVADLDALLQVAVTSNLVGPRPSLLLKLAAARRARRHLVDLCGELVATRGREHRDESVTLVDDLLDTHRADPQFLSEEDLPFHVASGIFVGLHTSAVIMTLALYEALKRPNLVRRMRAEADALFDNGIPEAPTLAQIDVTHRFLMETLRVHPLTSGLLRRVTNSFSFGGYSVPAGSDVLFAVAATHPLREYFRDPERFDIERFAPGRAEHRSPGVYAPLRRWSAQLRGQGLCADPGRADPGHRVPRSGAGADAPGLQDEGRLPAGDPAAALPPGSCSKQARGMYAAGGTDRRLRMAGRGGSLAHANTMAPLGTWIRVLWENGGVSPAYWGRLSRIVAVTTLAVPLRLAERLRFGGAVARTKIDLAPVFVLGVARSGTTHLQNLLSKDPQFGVVSTFQAAVPTFCLTGGVRLKGLMARLTPAQRPMDRMRISMDLPQEEEVALSNASPLSAVYALSFPRRAQAIYEKYSFMRGLSDRDLERWERAYLQVLRKATLLSGGRRLLLKSPVNTGRIPHLLRLFPEARFVCIVRNPYVVHPSLVHLFRSVVPTHQLHSVADRALVDLAVAHQRGTLRQYLKDRALIPQGRLVELRFENLEQAPEASLERVYGALRMSGWETARPGVRDYVRSLADYRKNRYEIDTDTVDLVRRECGFALKAWNYDVPEVGPAAGSREPR